MIREEKKIIINPVLIELAKDTLTSNRDVIRILKGRKEEKNGKIQSFTCFR